MTRPLPLEPSPVSDFDVIREALDDLGRDAYTHPNLTDSGRRSVHRTQRDAEKRLDALERTVTLLRTELGLAMSFIPAARVEVFRERRAALASIDRAGEVSG